MGGLKPFRTDLIIIAAAVALILSVFLVADLPRGNPDWFQDYYAPDDSAQDGGGGGADDDDGDGSGFETITEDVLSVSGHTAEGQSSSEPFTIEDSNTTGMTAALTWTDDIGSNDRFSLSIVYEGDELDSVSGTSGSLELILGNVQPGSYQVVITAEDCPGAGLGISPVDRDNGNDWMLSAERTVQVPAQGGGA